MKFIVN